MSQVRVSMQQYWKTTTENANVVSLLAEDSEGLQILSDCLWGLESRFKKMKQMDVGHPEAKANMRKIQ